MLPEAVRGYLFTGLSATPVVLDRLLGGATPAEFDRRPDPERYTIREVVAHLAYWETVWLERFQRILAEDGSALPDRNPDEWTQHVDRATVNVREQQALLRDRRQGTIELLRGLSAEQWERRGLHPRFGRATIEQLAVLMLAHDGYHLKQVTEWLNAADQ